ncbi:hypothetical protein, partial [Frankia sp. AgW1.1]|uniref:hypothetical protein n=1 Tax=Frankia sp. AgW1.1 TaxID=1836971 RepID=UPI001EE4D813
LPAAARDDCSETKGGMVSGYASAPGDPKPDATDAACSQTGPKIFGGTTEQRSMMRAGWPQARKTPHVRSCAVFLGCDVCQLL